MFYLNISLCVWCGISECLFIVITSYHMRMWQFIHKSQTDKYSGHHSISHNSYIVSWLIVSAVTTGVIFSKIDSYRVLLRLFHIADVWICCDLCCAERVSTDTCIYWHVYLLTRVSSETHLTRNTSCLLYVLHGRVRLYPHVSNTVR